MIQFGQPFWLFGLAAALLLLTGWAWWSDRRSRRLLERFVAGNLIDRLSESFSRPRHRFKSVLSVLACLLFLFALARPQWGTVTEEIELQGVDILFALDTSRSMLAEDYRPNRLERAKLAIVDLVSRLEGDRVGLIAFAGDAFLQCPLTLDYNSFLLTLDALDTNTIPRGGTDIAAAIEEAMAYFGDRESHRLLILMSDGEDLEASGIVRAREAAAQGITIFTVGVGSPEGALIPLRSPGGEADYLRDHAGNPVRTRLDEETLRIIASVTNGVYQRLGRGADPLGEIHAAARASVDELTAGSLTREIPIERYQWPLALGLLCLLLEWSIGNRRRLPRPRPAVALGTVVFAAILGSTAPPADASPRQAERAYRSGNYDEAARLWQQELERAPDNARHLYNFGNALYRAGDFAGAIEAYGRALPLADVALQERIFFNLGNAQFHLGQSELTTAPAQTRKLWDEAMENYDNSLALNPAAEDARNNRQWVEQQFTFHGARIEVAPSPARGGSTSPGGLLLPGMTLRLEAEANPEWRFVRWTGAEVADPDSPSTEMVVRESAQVIAIFRETRELVVESADPEQGTAGTSGRYDLGEEVPVTATAADYFAFDRWVSDELEIADPTAAETTVKLTGDGRVTATFTDAYRLDVVAEPAIAGNVGNSGFFRRYSETPIQAQPRDGFEWIGWTGQDIADLHEPQTTVTLNGDRTATAHFDRIWNLVVLPDRDEHGRTTGGGNHPAGTLQPIEAIPEEGHTFLRWEGPGVTDPEASSTTVEISSDPQDIIAIFEQDDENENSEGEGEGESSEEPDESDGSDESNDSEESDGSEEPSQPEEPETAEPEPAEPEAAEETTERETPESLTEEEARQLLQMLHQDERQLPLRIRPPGDDETTTGRDW